MVDLANPDALLLHFGLCIARTLGFVATSQCFSPPGVPWSLRMALSASLASCIGLVPGSDSAWNVSHLWLVGLVVKECVLGAALGTFLGAPLWAAETVGTLLDNQRGAMTGGSFNPLLSSSSQLDFLFQSLCLALLYASGAHLLVVEILSQSFLMWPVESFVPDVPVQAWGQSIDLFNAVLQTAATVALPFLLLMTLAEFGLAVISIYAPSLQAFQMAMPIKSLLCLVLTAMAASWLVDMGSTLGGNFLEQLLERMPSR